MDPRRERLRDILREKSVRFGDFLLASGRRSDIYVDVRQTSLHPEGATLIGELLLERLLPTIDAVGGPTLGADPVATAIAIASFRAGTARPAFLIRKAAKSHGAGNRLEGLGNVPAGAAVAIVEDTTTTGGSLLDAVEAAREAGLTVVQALCVVDREEGAATRISEAGLPFTALFTRRDLEA
jgi:orotate phosphoribosyltransferase